MDVFKRSIISPLIESALAHWSISRIAGLTSAYVVYPIAEKIENRIVRKKLQELRNFYALPSLERQQITKERLINIIDFAFHQVPYYQDLFLRNNINPQKINKDLAYLNDIPHLTKDIIRDQGERMLSRPLTQIRHHICKTGGSTGRSCVVYYNQTAADYSSAVTLYARERVGKVKSRSELHFACRFPDTPALTEWFTREDFKCFAMNRTNIFFDRLDMVGLEEILLTLKRRKPYLVHAHPSTIYSLACYLQSQGISLKLFEIFESSGELLTDSQRELISKVLQCRVINRYGLAELGVIAYQLGGEDDTLQILESEGWAESVPFADGAAQADELVFTGFRNQLMPLIRYRTGDFGSVERGENGTYLKNIVGRIHDLVPINGVNYPTHHIQDILDYRVGGIQEFQVDLRSVPPKLRIVPETSQVKGHIAQKINEFWGNAFELDFVDHVDLIRVGRHAKFRHVVTA